MLAPAIWCALALVAGCALGPLDLVPPWLSWTAMAVSGLGWFAASRRAGMASAPARIALVLGLIAAGCLWGARAARLALDTPIRRQLDVRFGGFLVGAPGVGGGHGPMLIEGTLLEDAWLDGDAARLRVRLARVRFDDGWLESGGDLAVTVGGTQAAQHVDDWRRGRRLRMPVTFRRPTRYLDPGVADGERSLALGGTTLLALVRSALLVEMLARGSPVDEWAADARARVRRAVARHVTPHGQVSGAIVSAVLIGDRSALPDTIRDRLQAAGTWHVIAISGGNIAIFVTAVLAALTAVSGAGRVATALTLLFLAAYAEVVIGGPSVSRAAVMAAVYLGARLFDHRAPPWHVLTLTGSVLAVCSPLDIASPGLLLTFGATAALLGAGPVLAAGRAARHTGPSVRLTRARAFARAAMHWTLAAVGTSLAAEVVLLPVAATAFSRVTAAGLLLNLVAIPLMTVVQFAGMALAVRVVSDRLADAAGLVAHLAAAGIVESARLVDAVPWLTRRVPPPAPAVIAVYYAALVLARLTPSRPARRGAVAAVLVSGGLMLAGLDVTHAADGPDPGTLRLTMLDVGQGEALLLQFPDGAAWLVDAGGQPFGGGGADIGARVVLPVLWSLGVRHLDALVLTHGDPDHVGGAPPVLDAFHPRMLLEGVVVPGHLPTSRLRELARAGGALLREVRAGEETRHGPVAVRVLHPLAPDWERRRVRNDDSVVIEVRYGDVVMLLAGDVGADVETALAPRLSRGAVRVLKVAHHGSRTSTAAALVEVWRPTLALVSAGRGNRFGHPAREVIERLSAAGAAVYRTDRDGAIRLDTDGRIVRVRTVVAAATRGP